MKQDPIINCQKVSKSFFSRSKLELRQGLASFLQKPDSVLVLKNIDLEIRRKEVVGLHGPNGSGKTTLLKLIAQIIRPTRGKVRVNGSVSTVLELGAGLHPDLTGRENINLYGTILGFSQSYLAKNFSKIINFADLGDKIDFPVRQFSSGMKSRLAFSIAAFSPAEILLLDEVFAVGDRDFLDKSRALLKKLKKNKTILLSSHNLQLLQGFTDRIIKLKQGSIDRSGQLYQLLFELPLGKSFLTQVVSNSMAPLIKKGEQVKVIRTKMSQIKPNDVVAVYFKNIQEIVIHRVLTRNKDELFLRGDNNDAPDQWLVGEHNLLGKVVLDKK